MRLIDADALYDFVMKSRYNNSHINKRDQWLHDLEHDCFLRLISAFPTIKAVEVVRCKYCNYFTEGMAIGMCKRIPDKPIIPIPYNHFCSYGERRSKNV